MEQMHREGERGREREMEREGEGWREAEKSGEGGQTTIKCVTLIYGADGCLINLVASSTEVT